MGLSETGTNWEAPYEFDGISDTYGAYYVLKVDPDASDPHKCMNFILHNGDEKAFGSANSKNRANQAWRFTGRIRVP